MYTFTKFAKLAVYCLFPLLHTEGCKGNGLGSTQTSREGATN